MQHPGARQYARSPERGSIAVLAAVVLVVVGAFLALSLNVGHKVTARTQLQAALDAGALAGAKELDGTTAGLAAVHTTAQAYAAIHRIDNAAVAVGLNASNAWGGDIVAGYWDTTHAQFYSDGQTVTIGSSSVTLDQATTPQFYNAVKVLGGADGSNGHNGALGVYFGAFLGSANNLTTSSSAIAVGGGPCQENGCALPLAVPSCALQDANGNLACGTVMTLNFNHGHGKDIAFADITQPSGQPNPNSVITQNQSAQTCSNPSVNVGDNIQLSNGNFFNNHVEDSFYGPNANMVCSDPAPYTNCQRQVISVVNISDCSAPMNGSDTVIGFVRVVITATQSTPGNARSITVYIDCTGTSSASSGCASFGYGSYKVRLAQ
jgi:Flp pilus assembly protein TadG